MQTIEERLDQLKIRCFGSIFDEKAPLRKDCKNNNYKLFLVFLFCSCSSLPIPMIPHSSHVDSDYYWKSGTAVMVSFSDSTSVALSAERMGSEIHATVYVRNQSRSPFLIGTNNLAVTGILDDGNAVDRDFSCIASGRQWWVTDGKTMPTTRTVKVSTARDVLKKVERQQNLSNILSGVATGLQASSYRSEAAQAITLQSGIDRAQSTRISQQELLNELQSGLFQRHTVFPGKAYVGVVRFPIARLETGVAQVGRPNDEKIARLYQICVTIGQDEHKFLLHEEPQ